MNQLTEAELRRQKEIEERRKKKEYLDILWHNIYVELLITLGNMSIKEGFIVSL